MFTVEFDPPPPPPRTRPGFRPVPTGRRLICVFEGALAIVYESRFLAELLALARAFALARLRQHGKLWVCQRALAMRRVS